jgi:hypothetical protein
VGKIIEANSHIRQFCIGLHGCSRQNNFLKHLPTRKKKKTEDFTVDNSRTIQRPVAFKQKERKKKISGAGAGNMTPALCDTVDGPLLGRTRKKEIESVFKQFNPTIHRLCYPFIFPRCIISRTTLC